jgi:uncharacterized membrane protein
MPRFCAACGGQMDDNAGFCPACGKSVTQAVGATGVSPAPEPGAVPTAGGLQDNVAGMLAYITIIPAIVFLVMEPYNKKPFVRFHSFQCLFLAVACFALGIVLAILGMIPFVGFALLFLAPIVWLAVLAVVIVCLLKAYQGKMFKLPVIGDIAEKQANG